MEFLDFLALSHEILVKFDIGGKVKLIFGKVDG